MRARRARMIDATVVAVVVTLVTALAHAMGGGGFPPLILLAGAAVWSLWCVFLVGGARARLPRTVLGVALSQPAMHLVFSLGGHTTVETDPHDHAAPLAFATTSHPDGSMLVAHIAAGLVSIAVLRWGAWVVRRAASCATRLVRRVRVDPPVLVEVTAPVAVPMRAPFVPRAALLALALAPHRGPPVLSPAH